jgi:hypothetical protein
MREANNKLQEWISAQIVEITVPTRAATDEEKKNA